jgi:hypothetical protein
MRPTGKGRLRCGLAAAPTGQTLLVALLEQPGADPDVPRHACDMAGRPDYPLPPCPTQRAEEAEEGLRVLEV